jgi:type IV secretion system protein VirD4
LLIRGGVGQCVQIPDWSVFVGRYDAACQALVARSGHPSIAGTRTPPARRAGGWRRLAAALR